MGLAKLSVSNIYSKLVGSLDGWDNKSFNWIWKANVSPRVKIFYWKVQSCRLPTRDRLAQRGCSTSVEYDLYAVGRVNLQRTHYVHASPLPLISSWISSVLGTKEVFADISDLVSHLSCVTVDQNVSKSFAQSVLMYAGLARNASIFQGKEVDAERVLLLAFQPAEERNAASIPLSDQNPDSDNFSIQKQYMWVPTS